MTTMTDDTAQRLAALEAEVTQMVPVIQELRNKVAVLQVKADWADWRIKDLREENRSIRRQMYSSRT